MKKILVFLLFLLVSTNVFAETYYIKDDGDNSLDGKTDATAWRSLYKLGDIDASDDVYLKCNDTWVGERIVVGNSGTLSDSGTTTGTSSYKLIQSGQNFTSTVSVGDKVFRTRDNIMNHYATVTNVDSNTTLTLDSNIMVSGDEYIIADYVTIGAYYDNGVIGVSGNKPVIDGTGLTLPNQYAALIQINTRPYVHVNNIDVINSYGQGIRYHLGSNYGILTNSSTTDTGNSGIQFNDNLTLYGLVEDCNVTRAGMSSEPAGGPFPNWPASFSATYSEHVTFRRCKARTSFGEAFGLFKSSDFHLVEYCMAYEHYSAGVYVDAGQDCVIRYNMIYGTTDPTYDRSPGWSGGRGIGVADEKLVSPRSARNQFYGNLVAFYSQGIMVGSHANYTSPDHKVYNNTIIDCNIGMSILPNGGILTGIEVKNNLIWNPSGGTLINPISTNSGVEYDYNHWGASVASKYSGPNDIVGTPSLHKMSGWKLLTAESLNIEDFEPQSDNIGNNVGLALNSEVGNLLDPSLTNYYTTPTNTGLIDPNDSGGYPIGALDYLGESSNIAPGWYLSPTGNDSNDGTSPSEALLTITELKTRNLQPGDDVYFECDGTWFEENLVIDWYGTLSDSGTTTGTSSYKLIQSGQNFTSTVSVGDTVHVLRDDYTIGVTKITAIDSDTSLSLEDDIVVSGDVVTIYNAVTIGSYYGNGTIGVLGNKPVIDGNYITPSTMWTGLIHSSNNGTSDIGYIHVENLKVINSAGQGVRFMGVYSGGSIPINYCSVKNVDTDYTYNAGIQFNRAYYGLIEDCTGTQAGSGWRYSRASNTRQNSTSYSVNDWIQVDVGGTIYIYTCTSSGTTSSSEPSYSGTTGSNINDGSATFQCRGIYYDDWPYCMGATQNSTGITVRGCTIYQNFSEAIGFYKRADYGIAEYNLAYENRMYGLYIDAGKFCKIRYNLVYGGNNSLYWRSWGGHTDAQGPGIGVADENLVEPRCEGNEFYGNFVAYTAVGMSFHSYTFTQAGTKFYNNTFVGNTSSVDINNSNGAGWSNSEIKNNIFDQAGGVELYDGPASTPGLTWNYNLWSSSVSDDQNGTNDPTPGSSNLSKTSGWRDLTAESLRALDFALQTGSPAINSGETLGSPYNNVINAEQTTFPNNIVLLDQTSYGNSDIGADIYAGGAVVTDPSGWIQTGWSSEEDVRNISGTLTIVLTDAIWDSTLGNDNDLTAALINELVGSLNCDTCWNTVVKNTLTHNDVTRVNDSTIVFNISAKSNYNILENEYVKLNILNAFTSSNQDFLASPLVRIAVVYEEVVGKKLNYLKNNRRISYKQNGKRILKK